MLLQPNRFNWPRHGTLICTITMNQSGLGVMVMKGYSIFSIFPKSVSDHWMKSNVIPKTPLFWGGVSYPFVRDIVSVF